MRTVVPRVKELVLRKYESEYSKNRYYRDDDRSCVYLTGTIIVIVALVIVIFRFVEQRACTHLGFARRVRVPHLPLKWICCLT